MCGRDDRTRYEMRNYMITSVPEIVRYTKIHIWYDIL